MSKKNYLLVVVGLVVLIVVVYLLVSAKSTGNNSQTGNKEKNNQVTSENSNALEVAPEATIVVPPAGTPMPAVSSTTELAPLTKQTPVVKATEPAKPVPAGVQLIEVEASGFEPRQVNAETGSEVSLFLRATDEATHKIIFTDSALSFIDISFSKSSGDKTINFSAPKIGSYNFYIDNESNKGTLVVN